MSREGPSSPRPKAAKRIRTSKPCDYCKSKKIRCQFPGFHEPSSRALPCEHCSQFNIECVVSGIRRTGSDTLTDRDARLYQHTHHSPSRTETERESTDGPSRSRESVGEGDDALATGVGLLSLAGSQEARFLGSSSGLTWARLVSATLHRQGILPSLHSANFSDPPLPFSSAPPLLSPPPPLPPVHLRLYYLDVAYKHIQARYACLDWAKIKGWHEEADSICGLTDESTSSIMRDHSTRMAAFFLWLVYGYGARLTEDLNLPGAVSHEVYYNAAIASLPTITFERSLLSVQAQLFLTFYTYRHPTTELSLWRLGGTAFRAAQEIGLHRRTWTRQWTALEEEYRRRTFWTAYVLDRMISMQLGRPFLFHDQDIDIQMPVDVNDDIAIDEVIAHLQEKADAAPSDGTTTASKHIKPVTTMSAFIHSVELNRIRTKIHDATYRVDPHHADKRSSGAIDGLLKELDHWRNQHPETRNVGQCSVQLPTEHWEMEYHHSVQTLLRPLSTSRVRNDDYAARCALSAGGLCRNQWVMIQRDSRNLSISALYRLFLSGLSLIFLAVNHPVSVPIQPETMSDLEACLQSLHVFVNQYPWATAYRDCFAQLRDRLEAKITTRSSDRDLDVPSSSADYTLGPTIHDVCGLDMTPNQAWTQTVPVPDPDSISGSEGLSLMGGDISLDSLLRSIGIDLQAPEVWDPQGISNGGFNMGLQ